MPLQKPCPCNSSKTYEQCCKPFHDGTSAKTAEALMRARYSAYALGLDTYLQQTYHPSTRPPGKLTDSTTRWLGLRIISTVEGNDGDTVGQVHFIARYKINGRAHRIDENSRFIFENGKWYYLQAE